MIFYGLLILLFPIPSSWKRFILGILFALLFGVVLISHSFNSRRAAAAASASGWLSSSSDTLRARLGTVYTRVPCARGAVEGSLVFS